MKTIFWNVDTEYDFMRNDESFKGALPVPNAREIEGNLELLTKFAERENLQVVNTADWHTMEDSEISLTPDFVSTYNPHCMAWTKGAEYVPATKPKKPYVVNWQDKGFDAEKVKTEREIVIYKNEFDVFAGNPYADKIVSLIKPQRAVVYGVALNVCDNFAIVGLRQRNVEVYAVLDAMKDLPHLKGTPLDTQKVIDHWEALGVKFVTAKEVVEGKI